MSKNQIFFEKLQSLRSLACVIYDRALASNLPQEEVLSSLEPVQSEYQEVMRDGVEGDLDGVATAIDLFESMAEAQAKYATEIMEKAKDLRSVAQEMREKLAASMDSRQETIRHGTLYNASLVDGIGEGGARRRQLVIR
jgi:hypothetical protein